MGSMTPEQVQAWRWEKELDERNRPLSDDELDALFPLVSMHAKFRWALPPTHTHLVYLYVHVIG